MIERRAERPDLSVVIPSRNTADLTLACLSSLGPGGGPESASSARILAVETIVVDDGSDDGTPEAVAAAFPEARVLSRPSGPGFTRCANAGLRAATGRLLLLLNSDTEVQEGALEALRRAFARDRSLGVAGAELLDPDGTEQWSAGRVPSRLWLFCLASGLTRVASRMPGYRALKRPGARGGAVDWVSGAAMAIRREVWEGAGELDERFRFYCQDLDYCLRVREAGWRVALVTGFRVVHLGGATLGRESERRASGGPAVVSAERQSPELLWTDLLRWSRKHRGETGFRRARAALRAGARFRVALRRLCGVLLPGSRGERWRRGTRAYAGALGALEGQAAPEDTPGSASSPEPGP